MTLRRCARLGALTAGPLAALLALSLAGVGRGSALDLTGAADAQLESNAADSHFGESVAVAGDVNGDGYDDVLVGASDYLVSFPAGAAFVFHGSQSGIASGDPSAAAATLVPGTPAAWPGAFGSVVVGVGDVNGDGYDDVAVGDPVRDSSFGPVPDGAGAAFIYHGSATGIASVPSSLAATRLTSSQAFANFGYVAPAGDVNGDGYDDVVVGAPGYDAGHADEGAAFLYLGRPGGIPNGGPDTADARIESNQAGALLGKGSTAAGDVDADGYGDLIVFASSYSAGESQEGIALLFLGSASGISSGDPTTADAVLESNRPLGNFADVAAAGDVDGDGYGDVVVGCPGCADGETNEGEVFVWRGSATGIAGGDLTSAATRLQGNASEALLGAAVAAVDVNGDGYDEVIAGAPLLDFIGSVLVYRGRSAAVPDGDVDTAWVRIDASQPFTLFGGSIGAGDVNGDGYGDVIVGNPFFSNGQSAEGAAFVHLGAGPVVPALPAPAASSLGLLLLGIGLWLTRAARRRGLR